MGERRPTAPAPARAPTLIIDNYDSYTHNLFQLCWTVTGLEPLVIHNDEEERFDELLESGAFDAIIVSPGPGTPERPEDFGICKRVLLEAPVPVFGVCLGCQGLGWLYGLSVGRAPGGAVHGLVRPVWHTRDALFDEITLPFKVVRYHSLALTPPPGMREDDFPPDLEKLAWTEDGIIMAIRHRRLPLWGVQFHPESICTESGEQLLHNFHELASSWRHAHPRAVPARAVAAHAPAARKAPPASGAIAEGGAGAAGLDIVHRKLEVSADSEEVYLALLASDPRAFWLDSSRRRYPGARFSFMGGSSGPLAYSLEYSLAGRRLRVTRGAGPAEDRADVDVLSFMQEELARARVPPHAAAALPFDFAGGFVGYLGYELKELCQDGAGPNAHRSAQPDAAFLFADRFIAIDHEVAACYVVGLVSGDVDVRSSTGRWLEDTSAAILRIAGRGKRRASEPDAAPRASPPAPASSDGDAQSAEDGGVLPAGPGTVAFPPAAPSAPASLQEQRSVEPLGLGASPQGGVPGGHALLGKKKGFAVADEREVYLAKVARCLEHIRAGDSYELCLTTRLHTPRAVEPLAYFRRLRRANPAPYAALLRFGAGLAVCSSSPERFLRIRADGRVECKPIKGTRPRGLCPEEDESIAHALACSEKDRAENLMIVDLVRNDFGRVCCTGSVRCPRIMAVETFPSVHQLVSTVEGQLRPGTSAVECVRAAFPMGSMTGAPKKRSMQLLDALEVGARGIYSGSIGYFSASGAADLSVVIRSAVVTPEGVTVGAGGAITVLSDPGEEWEEVLLKARTVVGAV